MTRIWNPYVFTPLGNPIVGEAPPVLRVMGGMQATAQQLSYAQQRFTQFVMQARLSTVPNPTEAGRLPDGTQYRIVKVGPQTVMEIWPGGSSPAWDGAGVGVSVLLDNERYLFLLTFVKKAWKVTRPPEFFGGDGLWVPVGREPYYLTFNARQGHAGYFPSKGSAIQTPPTPVQQSSSKRQAVAYENGGQSALATAVVAGDKYVGVAYPQVLGHTATLTLCRANAVTANAIKETPFAAAATADPTSSVAVVGSGMEAMRLHEVSMTNAAVVSGAKAGFALADTHQDLRRYFYAEGLFRYPMTRLLSIALPGGAVSTRSVEFESEGECRQVVSQEPIGPVYIHTEYVPAVLRGFADDFGHAPPDVEYDDGARYMSRMSRGTHAWEIERTASATAFSWTDAGGAVRDIPMKCESEVVLKTTVEGYFSERIGGFGFYVGPGFFDPPNRWIVLGQAIGYPLTTASYTFSEPPPVQHADMNRERDNTPYTIYGAGDDSLTNYIKQFIPNGFHTSTTRLRSEKSRSVVTAWGKEFATSEVDTRYEFEGKNTVVGMAPSGDSTPNMTPVFEFSMHVRCDVSITLRSFVHFIPGLDVAAFIEAKIDYQYDGPPSQPSTFSHVFTYENRRSFVVVHKGKEIFRTVPTVTNTNASVLYTGAQYEIDPESWLPYAIGPGEVAATWDELPMPGTRLLFKLNGEEDEFHHIRFRHAGIETVTGTATGYVLNSASMNRGVPDPKNIGAPPITPTAGVPTHSLAHAIDPNSGGGVVFVFQGTYSNLQSNVPVAGWAISPTGQVTPISDLLAQYEGHPLTPSAKIEAVISV